MKFHHVAVSLALLLVIIAARYGYTNYEASFNISDKPASSWFAFANTSGVDAFQSIHQVYLRSESDTIAPEHQPAPIPPSVESTVVTPNAVKKELSPKKEQKSQLPKKEQKKEQKKPSGKKEPVTKKSVAEKSTLNSVADKSKAMRKVISSPAENAVGSKEACPYNFKVFVYPLPKHLSVIKVSEEARKNHTLHVCRKCIWEQFSLEYIFYDFFTQFCGRTHNPSEADFFYLPIVREAEFRWGIDNRAKNARQPSQAEQALLNIIEKGDSGMWKNYFGVTDEYWRRKQGADHILVMPAPVTNFRHEAGRRGFFHYMLHLTPPIYVGLEYSASFLQEYPLCNKLKNIVVPYPTVDPDLFAGRYTKRFKDQTSKTSLLYYAGGLHGECFHVRKAMRDIMINGTKLKGGVVPARVKTDMFQREKGFFSSVFCPIPIGDSPSSKRMYDVLNFDCIPVVISDELLWAFSKEVGGTLDASSYSIQLPQCIVHFTLEETLRKYPTKESLPTKLPSGTSIHDLLVELNKEDQMFKSLPTGGNDMLNPKMYENGIYVNPLVRLLRKIPAADITTLQNGVKNVAKYFRYYKMASKSKYHDIIPTALHIQPDGDAITMFSEQLGRIKEAGVDNVHKQCVEEKNKKHNYIGSYPCDKTAPSR